MIKIIKFNNKKDKKLLINILLKYFKIFEIFYK